MQAENRFPAKMIRNIMRTDSETCPPGRSRSDGLARMTLFRRAHPAETMQTGPLKEDPRDQIYDK